MANVPRLYWDSCAWLGLLNGEIDKKRALEIIYGNAREGRSEIWTSTLSMVEVRQIKAKGETKATRPLKPEHMKIIDDIFKQHFVKPIPLSVDIAHQARYLWRNTASLGKWQDSIHLASALRWNCDELHTYDYEDLIHLSMAFDRRDGQKLKICDPNESVDGPLFSGNS